jgi:hypothetical protein
MPLASSVRFHIGSRHLLILALVIGASLLATKAWKSLLWSRWSASAGPFVEFEVRLPSGIILFLVLKHCAVSGRKLVS